MTYRTALRRVDGAIIVDLPESALGELKLDVGSTVELSIESGRIVVTGETAASRLEVLLALCDPSSPFDRQDADWTGGPVF